MKTKRWNADTTADLVAEAIQLDSGVIDEEIRGAESKQDAVRRMEDLIRDCEAALICIRGPKFGVLHFLSPRELATVLAALRLWQRRGPFIDAPAYTKNDDLNAVLDIATDFAKLKPLTILDVDALCERLNSEA